MDNSGKRTIIIIPATVGAATAFLQKNDTRKIDFWIYLGRHPILCADIERIIGRTIKKKEVGDELQQCARSHRKNYIDFIGNLAQTEKKPFWYLTSLSEKNPYVSLFFLNFCFMQALITILSSTTQTFCIFCESDALARSLKKNLEIDPHLNLTCEILPYPSIKGKILSFVSRIRNKSWFVIRFLCRIIYAKCIVFLLRGTRKNGVDSDNIIIHSWVDQRSFPDSGTYLDTYFGELGTKLGNNGLKVTYLLDILPAIWYPVAVKKILPSNERWILFEEFLAISDIVSALFLVYKQRTWNSQTFVLSGLDVSDLVAEERVTDKSSSRAEQSYLSYCVGKKICRSSSHNSFVYTFENHIWEKMIIEGIRHNNHGTYLIGYAHSTVNKMDLHYSISRLEVAFAPLPDMILVNGIRTKQKLAESGFGSIPTEIIGAIRYGGLTPHHRVKENKRKSRILIILSVNFGGSIEMILKCSEAFRNIDGVEVILKPHPAHKISDFSKYISKIPRSFIFSTEPIQDLFKTTDLVIYTDSTAAVEAAVREIPLLHMKSSFAIDINIFEDCSIIPSVNSPEMIKAFVEKTLKDNVEFPEEIYPFIKSLFSPVDEQKILSVILSQKES